MKRKERETERGRRGQWRERGEEQEGTRGSGKGRRAERREMFRMALWSRCVPPPDFTW